MDGATVVIIGAGPGGLTAAYELVNSSRARVIVLEASDDLGGISKTVAYKGNRIDIGGHRFFSKSDWVMDWWQNILPISAARRHTVRDRLSEQAAYGFGQRVDATGRRQGHAGALAAVAHLLSGQVLFLSDQGRRLDGAQARARPGDQNDGELRQGPGDANPAGKLARRLHDQPVWA